MLPPPFLSNYIISFMQYPLLPSSLSFVTLCIGVMLVFVTQGGREGVKDKCHYYKVE